MKILRLTTLTLIVLCMSAGSAFALDVTPTNDGNVLVDTILGSGITATNISYNGASIASATFTGGVSSGIGIESGILLTSGDANLAVGPNTSDAATSDNGLPGNADLTNLSGYPTYDATLLQFDFMSAGGDVFFNYVFASEEYNEFTNTQYNDVFAFFLDGVNIALIPGTDIPVTINNVNGGNPYGTNASYPEYYNNNDLNDGGPFFDIEYDGFTDVFTAQALGLDPGSHTIILAISDAGDPILDSGVFIQAGSFSDKPVPEPSTILLLGSGLFGVAAYRRKFKK